MTLFSPDGIQQEPIGRREHWRLFERFIGSPLHELFISEIEQILDSTSINSSIAGKEILTKLEKSNEEAFEGINPNDNGGLFGMTLWNFLVLHDDDWLFTSIDNDSVNVRGKIYRRGSP